jgi:nucleoside-diphosphate-sugar epimerase
MVSANSFVNPSAQSVWARSLTSDDRVLVTGASGWFGQTAAYLLKDLPQSKLFVASSDRVISGAGGELTVQRWDENIVSVFRPTVVIDCAFLTRDLVTSDGLADYVRINEELTRRLIKLTNSPSVKRVVTISSGAAMYPVDAAFISLDENPYGFLKRQAEIQLKAASEQSGTSAVVARAWAVSGAFVGKPQNYALAGMIIQAARGHISISAERRVSRRYSSVEDLLALSLAETNSPGFSVVDSEGPLVEMAELAMHIVEVINPAATISRPNIKDLPENDYWSPTYSWPTLCARHQLAPAGLKDQIMRTYNGLKKMGLA